MMVISFCFSVYTHFVEKMIVSVQPVSLSAIPKPLILSETNTIWT
jgi:hypothetical protein